MATSRIEQEIQELRKDLLDMAGVADSMFERSIGLIKDPTDVRDRIDRIKTMDNEVDSKEVDIDSKCVRLLSLYAPEARQLRTTVAVMKINNDVERVGDHAVNVARLVGKSADYPPVGLLKDTAVMAERALEMFRMSIEAFMKDDKDLALKVPERDKEVDRMESVILGGALEHSRKFPQSLAAATCMIVIARNIERAADLATNISEDTYYLLTGEVIKHA